MNIILAVDGSKNSEWAVDFLLKIPLAEMPQIKVLHVVPLRKHITPFLDAVYHKLFKDAMQEKIDIDIVSAEKQNTRIVEKLKSRWDDVASVIEKGHVSDKIIEKAKEFKTDLIILGSRGLSSSRSFFLGGVSQKVATYAPCSVLVVKKKIRTLKRILIATDGSVYSKAAATFLKSHFLTKEISITFLNVWDYPINIPEFSFEAIGKTHLQEMHKVAFMSNALCVEGDPAEMVTDTAYRRKIKLVIIGSKGLTGKKRFLLGSVARKIITHSNCSVLVVKSIDKINLN